MYTIEIIKQCGCFTRRGMNATYTFKTEEEATTKATSLCKEMNEEFCGKHHFEIRTENTTFKIVEAF